jgi:acetyl-CoA synthetase
MTSHKPLADHYGQSETGMIVNCHWGDCLIDNNDSSSSLTRYPVGSMGYSMPGYHCVSLNEDEAEECGGSVGQLAVDIPASPLYWFRGYWNQPDRTLKCHSKSKQYYLTGDLVHSGPDSDPRENDPLSTSASPSPPLSPSSSNLNFFWYLSRNDDIITSSGYRIGPSDIERCFLRDPRVKDVGVYGVKDPEGLRGEIIVATIVLYQSTEREEALAKELQNYLGETLSKHCKPKRILFQTKELPRTPSGKIQRFKLREGFHALDSSSRGGGGGGDRTD